MIDHLLKYVERLEKAELKKSCTQYETHFERHEEAALVLGEELSETELELAIAKRYMAMFDRGIVSPGHLRDMEDRMRRAACEAIQTAAMCKKWEISLRWIDKDADKSRDASPKTAKTKEERPCKS